MGLESWHGAKKVPSMVRRLALIAQSRCIQPKKGFTNRVGVGAKKNPEMLDWELEVNSVNS